MSTLRFDSWSQRQKKKKKRKEKKKEKDATSPSKFSKVVEEWEDFVYDTLNIMDGGALQRVLGLGYPVHDFSYPSHLRDTRSRFSLNVSC